MPACRSVSWALNDSPGCSAPVVLRLCAARDQSCVPGHCQRSLLARAGVISVTQKPWTRTTLTEPTFFHPFAVWSSHSRGHRNWHFYDWTQHFLEGKKVFCTKWRENVSSGLTLGGVMLVGFRWPCLWVITPGCPQWGIESQTFRMCDPLRTAIVLWEPDVKPIRNLIHLKIILKCDQISLISFARRPLWRCPRFIVLSSWVHSYPGVFKCNFSIDQMSLQSEWWFLLTSSALILKPRTLFKWHGASMNLQATSCAFLWYGYYVIWKEY